MKRGASGGLSREKKRSRAEELVLSPVTRDDSSAACGRCFNLCVGQDGTLHAWGRNSVGQLGNGDKIGQLHPVLIPIAQEVVSVAAGNFHSVALVKDGSALVWGSQARGRLGLGDAHAVPARRHMPITIPRGLFAGARVMSAACGLHHTAFLTSTGELWMAGCNEFGQLGRVSSFGLTVGQAMPSTVSLAGTPAAQDPVIVSIASGRHHMLALTRGGHLLSWGKGDVGQLGNGDTRSTWELQNIGGPLFLNHVKYFTAGRNHSVALCHNDTMWSWGQAVDAQLGHGDQHDRVRPTEVVAFHDVEVRHVACTSRATHLVTEDGRLFSWGFTIVPRCAAEYAVPLDGDHLYWDYVMNPVDVTRECAFPPEVTPLRLYPGSTHVVMQMSDHRAYVWGDNPHGVGQQRPGEYPNWRNGVWPPVAMDRLQLRAPVDRRGVDQLGDSLTTHLSNLLEEGFLSDVRLRNIAGREFPAHQFVLFSRCPVLLPDAISPVPLPRDSEVCELLLRWVYTKRESRLSELSSQQLLELITTLTECAPYLGHLRTLAQRRFVLLLGTNKEAALIVANVDPLTSYQREVVVSALADHLAAKRLSAAEMSQLSRRMSGEVAVLSHLHVRVRPAAVKLDEASLASSFRPRQGSEESSDFVIEFPQEHGRQIKAHACMLARVDFFNRLLRNPLMGNSRTFQCNLPVEPMQALLTYIYGGEAEFTCHDALHLLSYEHGIRFFWASDPEFDEELAALEEELQKCLEDTPVMELVDALLTAQKLNISLAEQKLLSLITQNYEELKHHIGGLPPELLLEIRGQLLDKMQDTIKMMEEEREHDLNATLPM